MYYTSERDLLQKLIIENGVFLTQNDISFVKETVKWTLNFKYKQTAHRLQWRSAGLRIDRSELVFVDVISTTRDTVDKQTHA